MKLALFTVALATTAAAVIIEDDEPIFDDQMFGQVSAESLDFNEVFDDAADFFL